MESEAVSSVKIAILLMITGTLIFIIVVLVSTTKSYIFDTIIGVVNVTDEERTKQFDDYDQKWVSGTKVLRVLKLYEDTGFGIAYQTAKTKSNGDYAVNFGGIFLESTKCANGYGGDEYRIPSFSVWKTKDGTMDTFYTKTFQMNGINVKRYEDKTLTRHLGTDSEYIQPGGRFYAELIKNRTGEFIGICFTQE